MTPPYDGSPDPQAAACLAALKARGQTVGTAESLTAGLVSATLATVPGASDVLRGGVTAYATDLKVDLLGVDPDLIAAHTAYSTACAEAMATGVRRLFGCDWGVATTGVAGPEPDDGHPAGEVHVAVSGPGGVLDSVTLALAGDRQQIRSGAVAAVLDLLLSRV